MIDKLYSSGIYDPRNFTSNIFLIIDYILLVVRIFMFIVKRSFIQ